MSVTMRPVVGSTAITAEGYDPQTRELVLQFSRANHPTIIEDVDPATYQQFLAARSKGRFFQERLKV